MTTSELTRLLTVDVSLKSIIAIEANNDDIPAVNIELIRYSDSKDEFYINSNITSDSTSIIGYLPDGSTNRRLYVRWIDRGQNWDNVQIEVNGIYAGTLTYDLPTTYISINDSYEGAIIKFYPYDDEDDDS